MTLPVKDLQYNQLMSKQSLKEGASGEFDSQKHNKEGPPKVTKHEETVMNLTVLTNLGYSMIYTDV